MFALPIQDVNAARMVYCHCTPIDMLCAGRDFPDCHPLRVGGDVARTGPANFLTVFVKPGFPVIIAIRKT